MQKVSLIATVWNDVDGTKLFLRRLGEQTRKPDEVVVLDAGSTDGTFEALEDYRRTGEIPLVLLQEPRCKPAKSRNLCARTARYAILAVTDIGCDWSREWFEELVAPFEGDPELDAVMGSWEISLEEQRTPWAQVDPLLRNGLRFEATPASHAANRAIAYKKEFYLRLGGLPEDLSFAADDLTLALLIHAASTRIGCAPTPRCVWFRPQTFKSLVKESRRNFRGMGEAGIAASYFLVNALRFVAELSAVALIGFGACSAGGALLVAALSLRLRNWFGDWRRARARRALATIWHLILLDYSTRLAAVLGYLEGWRYGRRHCHDIRRKLRSAGIGAL